MLKKFVNTSRLDAINPVVPIGAQKKSANITQFNTMQM